jgi:hypothetical protein
MAKKKRSKLTRILLRLFFGLLILIFVLLGILYLVTYFYGNGLAKDYLVKTINTASKGLYKAEIKSLRIEPLTGGITIRGFDLIPDTAFYNAHSDSDSLSPMLIALHIRKFQVKDFDIKGLVRERKLRIGKILLEMPEVTIYLKKIREKKKGAEPNPKMLSLPLPKGLILMKLDEIALQKGKITVINQVKSPSDTFHVPSVDVQILGILVDSVHTGTKRIFNADDIRVTITKLQTKTKNGMYTIKLGEVGLSTKSRHLWVKGLELVPAYNNRDFSRKLGYQMDRMEVTVGSIDLLRLSMRRLIIYRELAAEHLIVSKLVLGDYRDKRVPERKNFFPPMPHVALRNANLSIRLDTVELKDGYLAYSEQTGNSPGSLFFDKANVMALNVTNDTALYREKKKMQVTGTLYLMGKGKLDVNLDFPFGAKNDAFIFSATLGQMSMPAVNPMLSKLAPAEILSGTIRKMVIPPVKADNNKAVGTLDLYYNDLKVNMTAKDTSTWQQLKSGVISWAANVYVNSDNPTKKGKFKPGIIYFERNKTKSIFNFLWKSTFSGIKSTIGINSDKQKELKKAKKKKK